MASDVAWRDSPSNPDSLAANAARGLLRDLARLVGMEKASDADVVKALMERLTMPERDDAFARLAVAERELEAERAAHAATREKVSGLRKLVGMKDAPDADVVAVITGRLREWDVAREAITRDHAGAKGIVLAVELLQAERAQADRRLALLKRLEWIEEQWAPVNTEAICPFCGNFQSDGHASDCALAAELREAQP